MRQLRLWDKLSSSISVAAGLLLASFAATGRAQTFTQDIAPILERHCLRCHRAGGIAGIAPFTSYQAARPWAKAIKEMVALRRMPPWPADPARSLKFRNDARLNPEDLATLIAWVDAGAPEGPPQPNRNAPSDWPNPAGRPPDLVISMTRPAQLPASGEIPYLRFLVQLPLAEDRWISACQARPGNASVVHHMAITEVELPRGVSPENVEGIELLSRKMGLPGGASIVRPVVVSPSDPAIFDMLAIYTPGAALEEYPADTGKLLQGGANRYINFNIHYTPNGQPSSDLSQVAFWFRDTPPKHQILRVPMAAGTVIANGKELSPDTPGIKAEGTHVVIPPIPPGASNYELTSITTFPQPVTIYQFHPHAHAHARDFKYEAIYPDGRKLTLLTVPQYDFRWQLAYELETPLKLPAGAKLIVTAHYDNRDSAKAVYFRDQNQSTDEMFSPFVQYSVDSSAPSH